MSDDEKTHHANKYSADMIRPLFNAFAEALDIRAEIADLPDDLRDGITEFRLQTRLNLALATAEIELSKRLWK